MVGLTSMYMTIRRYKMTKFPVKHAIAVAVLAGASMGAQADTLTDLGTLSTSSPTTFSGIVGPTNTGFSDIFTFTPQEPNFGAGATVVNVPLSFGGFSFDTALATMSLVSAGADGIAGNGDDSVLQSVVLPSPGNSQDMLTLNWDTPMTGLHYLNVTGVAVGSEGGIYSGAIAAAIPEPETYAMLLAGLGLMGAVVRRRGMRKTS
ncbi:MAG: hypothetical protein K0S36_243 [Nitrosospira multiformis]|nr:hypothetical protein [Nitrosospira multiformis]